MAKKETKENEIVKKESISKTKTATKKTAKKVTDSKSTTKKATTSKPASKSKAAKKTTTRKSSTRAKKAVTNIMEYYDLPVLYNKTTVKLLFQTPKKLFVYWEISKEDKQKYLDQNGKNFFEETSPFLVVKNTTKNYSFEIEVNDFANSWYFDVPDSNCEYDVSLIRKHNVTKSPTLITSSNELEVPNNTILFEQDRKEIFFKNVKTNDVVSKTVVNLQFMNHLGNVYNANSFYKKFYHEEDLMQITNPTSN